MEIIGKNIDLSKKKVAIAISNFVLRRALNDYLRKIGFEIVTVYKSLSQLPIIHKPDLLIFNTISDSDYILLKKIQEKHKAIKTILFNTSKFRLIPNFLFSKKNKLDAFLFEAEEEDLFKIIAEIFSGVEDTIYLPSRISSLFLKKNIPLFEFLDNELEILALLSEGVSQKEIIQKINIGKRKFEYHRFRLLNKFETFDIFEIIVYAYDMSYLPKTEKSLPKIVDR